MNVVVDASVVVDVLALKPPQDLAEQWDALAAAEVSAPHVLDLEVLHSLRRHVRDGRVSPARAKATLEALEALPLIRYPHVDLLGRIWVLRHNFSGYDAAYVALAEALGAPLFTRDARLAQAARTFTGVRLV